MQSQNRNHSPKKPTHQRAPQNLSAMFRGGTFESDTKQVLIATLRAEQREMATVPEMAKKAVNTVLGCDDATCNDCHDCSGK